MEGQNWEQFGEDIKKSVQDAVESGDFSSLNQTVTDTVNGVMNGLGDAMRGFTGSRANGARRQAPLEFDYRTGTYRKDTEQSYHYKEAESSEKGNAGSGTGSYKAGSGSGTYNSGGRTADRYQYGGGADGEAFGRTRTQYRYNRPGRGASGGRGLVGGGAANQGKMLPALYARPTGLQVGGWILSGVGGMIALGCGSAGIICLLAMAFGGAPVGATAIAVGILGMCTGIFGAVAGVGASWRKSVKRFRSYVRALGGKEYGDVKMLARQMRKSPKYVIKDLRKMIARGWFREGHLDDEETCLMVSDNAYQQYTALLESKEESARERELEKMREEREIQKMAAQMREEEAENDESLPVEVREILKSGEEYLRKIHACNDAIPGQEISAKISRIEILVDRIFVRVKEQPDTVSDLHRMMQYYLPTTVKLLEAYEQLDKQPVQGENIRNSKREIEKTLDTLNVAFEKLLDSLFQDTAWDVSSDISVLQTMLAQEGLTEEAFKRKNAEKEEQGNSILK